MLYFENNKLNLPKGFFSDSGFQRNRVKSSDPETNLSPSPLSSSYLVLAKAWSESPKKNSNLENVTHS